jgi:hypothetical protein
MASHETGLRTGLARPKMALFLLGMGLITREQMDLAVSEQRKWNQGRIGEWLRYMGFVGERDITIALSKQFGVPWVDITHAQISEHTIRILPAQIARTALIFPLEYDSPKRALSICFGGTIDFPVSKVLRKMLDSTITSYIGDESQVIKLITKHYGSPLDEPKRHEDYGATLIKNAPVLAEFILSEAKRSKAENIMIEVYMHMLWARFLIAGRHDDLFIDLLSEKGIEQS